MNSLIAFMATAKANLNETMQQQSEDGLREEIAREPALTRMIERGLEDSRSGRIISNEEMKRRIRKWQR